MTTLSLNTCHPSIKATVCFPGFARSLEAQAMQQSAATVVLSASDRDYLIQHVAPASTCTASTHTTHYDCKVLQCALREELAGLSPPADLGLSLPSESDRFPAGSHKQEDGDTNVGLRGTGNLNTPGDQAKGGGSRELGSLSAPSSAEASRLSASVSSAQAAAFQARRPFLTCCVRLAKVGVCICLCFMCVNVCVRERGCLLYLGQALHDTHKQGY